ncbi:TIGR02285 family protein [Pseudoduganella danionis]|uniref:TIGR02285 family protein n=1 Tax=Pseudoduganella danionis TaxID=1890295 RepID=A0ABW9SS27_9BURK|nr:TIGR02285 family protein [Pseudoduganella danionis]MTW33504.1 TIGR02285 family protein [Pseudoduganella danionis]
MRQLCYVLLLFSPVMAMAQNVMTWLMTDLPPASIRVAGLPSDGITDQQIAYIRAHWPEVEHRVAYANLKRSWALLEAGQQACYSFTLITPQRLERAYIVPTSVLPPPQLIFRRDALPSLPLNAQHEVDLERLLAQRQLRGLLSEKRSFGLTIDHALQQRSAQALLEVTPVGSLGENIFARLLVNRTDYTIDYDFVYAYYLKRDPMLRELLTLPIAGNAAPIRVGFACPRTAWGKATALKISSILATREGVQMLRQSTERWLSPESRQRYSDALEAFYHARENPALGLTPP